MVNKRQGRVKTAGSSAGRGRAPRGAGVPGAWAALCESEAGCRAVFDQARDSILLLEPGPDGIPVIREANVEAQRLHGYSREELLGRPISLLDAESTPQLVRELVSGVRASGSLLFEVKHRRKDGSVLELEASVKEIESGGRRFFLDISRDITERKRAERTLRETKEYLENLIGYANVPIIVWDRRHRITRFNRAFELLTGRSAAEVVGQPIELLFPSDRGDSAMRFIRKTQTGERWEEVEIEIAHSDGTARTVLWNSATSFEEDGTTPLATIAQGYDITGRKQRENEILRTNEDLTGFLYAASHDLKSPLVTIKTFIGYLEQQDIPNKDSAAIAKDFSFINLAADKMSRLLEELLALSRAGRNSSALEEFPLCVLLEEAAALAGGRIAGRGIKVSLLCETATLFGVETVRVHGDRQRLLEVFQNLLDNAAKFMGTQPEPHIEAGVDLSGAEPVFFVRDNGIGLDPRHADKVFGLFEKLDRGTEGAGMGLALARKVIAAHGGRIWAESEGAGRGTAFRFTLADTKRIIRGGECKKVNLQ